MPFIQDFIRDAFVAALKKVHPTVTSIDSFDLLPGGSAVILARMSHDDKQHLFVDTVIYPAACRIDYEIQKEGRFHASWRNHRIPRYLAQDEKQVLFEGDEPVSVRADEIRLIQWYGGQPCYEARIGGLGCLYIGMTPMSIRSKRFSNERVHGDKIEYQAEVDGQLVWHNGMESFVKKRSA